MTFKDPVSGNKVEICDEQERESRFKALVMEHWRASLVKVNK